MLPSARRAPILFARILTFTSEPLEFDLEVVGPIKLVLYAASSNTDTDFIVKLSEQFPSAAAEQTNAQPRFRVVSKGWMKASHREAPTRSCRRNMHLGTRTRAWNRWCRARPIGSKCQ